MKFIFTQEEREKFLPAVKIAIATKTDINKGIDIETACRCGYLDVSRAPLRGINTALQRVNSSATSTEVRDKCISDCIIPAMNRLLSGEVEYDTWHRELCEKIYDYYKENGYDFFNVGKAQKWINMAIKYACIYDYDHQEQLERYINVFHVPIDRYIANPIARKLNINPPCYKGKNLDTFDAEKRDYVWSNINDYDDYLRCQKEIRDKCGMSSPLKWEFKNWEEEKQKQSKNKN